MTDMPIRIQLSSAKSVKIHTSSAIQISSSKSAPPNQLLQISSSKSALSVVSAYLCHPRSLREIFVDSLEKSGETLEGVRHHVK
jgi:hypothetical protein